MLIVAGSPDVIIKNGLPNNDIAQVLIDTKAQGNPVGLISNHREPSWFQSIFGGTRVQFFQTPGRQSGDIIQQNAERLHLNSHDVLVLATKRDDIAMGKNSGAVLVAAGWSNDDLVQNLGIRVDSADELREVINLTANWPGEWWYVANNKPMYSVKALADLSGYGVPITQQIFATKLTTVVKSGGSRINALLAITARSLLTDGLAHQDQLAWGVYPSSSSTNDDSDVLSDFTHRLRTTVSRVRYAKRDVPLFIRHKNSPKRSGRQGGDRTDPAGQIESIHLNPYYKNKLSGRHVIVIDDCTTYGLSFGVAAALLRKAGASAVTGVALGKFGNQLHYYEIAINTDPFEPIRPGCYSVQKKEFYQGNRSGSTQHTLQVLIP